MGQTMIVKPAEEHLARYVAALSQGWSPDNVRGKAAADEQLEAIAEDPAAFHAAMDDPLALGPPIALPDGTSFKRLPGIIRWIWDGDFCGSIGFRWQAGTSRLPAHVLGHIGFAVVPWKRRQGHATRALALMLDEARRQGLDHVELTADPDNLASQRVITANGGELVETFTKVAAYGGGQSLLFRIGL